MSREDAKRLQYEISGGVLASMGNYLESPLKSRRDLFPLPGEIFEKQPAQPFEVVFHNETGRAIFPPTILFGSSFLDRHVMTGFYSFFKDVYRARGLSNEMLPALQNIPPGTRYFIFQFWEPHALALRNVTVPSD